MHDCRNRGELYIEANWKSCDGGWVGQVEVFVRVIRAWMTLSVPMLAMRLFSQMLLREAINQRSEMTNTSTTLASVKET